MLRINTNVAAINTLRQSRLADDGVSKALERLSSGLRVNRASDDAAGLSISESLRGQLRGNARAAANIQDGISLINVADGALNEVHAVLQRMRELAVQSANGSLAPSDRAATEQEFLALQAEIGNIASNTSFNGMALFVGLAGGFTSGSNGSSTVVAANGGMTIPLPGSPTFSSSALNSHSITVQASPPGPPPAVAPPPQTLNFPADYSITQTLAGYNGTTPLYNYSATINPGVFTGTGNWTVSVTSNQTWPTSNLPLPITMQVGANTGQTLVVSVPPINPGAIGVGSTVDISSQTGAQAAITACDMAIANVSTARSGMAATANRMEHAMTAQQISKEMQSASESRIRDQDMADQMTTLTRQQILMQSSVSMLSIANDSRTILGLFS